MLITERKLRQIIRSVLKEQAEDEIEIKCNALQKEYESLGGDGDVCDLLPGDIDDAEIEKPLNVYFEKELCPGTPYESGKTFRQMITDHCS